MRFSWKAGRHLNINIMQNKTRNINVQQHRYGPKEKKGGILKRKYKEKSIGFNKRLYYTCMYTRRFLFFRLAHLWKNARRG